MIFITIKKTVVFAFIFLILYNSKSYSQVISTYAGNGYNGFGNNGIATYSGDGGLATNAQINPYQISIDSKGNIYIAQGAAFYTVRKIDAITRIITTVAGNGTSGYSGDGGPATSAQLDEPRGIAFDSNDNLYISDYWNNCIRKVDALTGIITTIAGNGNMLNGYSGDGGLAKDALLFEPQDIALDKSNNIYIADFNNNCVRRIDALTGIITKIAGSDPPGYPGFTGDGGLAINARLYGPTSIKVNKNGDIYFADLINNRIRKIDYQTGIITTIAGNGEAGFNGDGGLAINAQIFAPYGIALDASGNLYVCAGANNQGSYKVRKIDINSGIITTVAGTGSPGYNGDGESPLKAEMDPTDLVFDNKGDMYIADNGNFRVRKVTYSQLIAPNIIYKDSCAENPILFSLSSTSNIDAVMWNFGDPESGTNNSSISFTPKHTFTAAGNYAIKITVQDGTMTATNTKIIEVTNCGSSVNPTTPAAANDIYIPNTFTPNGDGINDKFNMTAINAPVLFDLNIFTRYGMLIFQSKNINISWDGKYKNSNCPVGVYYYILRYQFANNTVVIKSGNITLLH